MPTSQKFLRSETGFESPGFTVDSAGNINFVGSLKSNGVTLLTPTALSSSVLNSSLTSVGTLSSLSVNGAVSITGNSAVTVNTAGTVTISSGEIGTINNVNIGTTTPGTATFTSLVVTESVVFPNNQFLIPNPEVTGSINNYNIGNLIRGTGAFTTLAANTGLTLTPSIQGTIENVNIGATSPGPGKFTSILIRDTSNPTQNNQVVTKSYVDNKIPALAIALGA